MRVTPSYCSCTCLFMYRLLYICSFCCCKQAVVGAVFKALKAKQSHLGIKVPDVKSCVSLAPLSAAELHTAFGLAVQIRLSAVGWFALTQHHMLEKSLWEVDTASLHCIQSVKLSVSSIAPDKVALKLETGKDRRPNVRAWPESAACLRACQSVQAYIHTTKLGAKRCLFI